MDADYALALQLNDLLNKEEEEHGDIPICKVDHGKPSSIVDDSWELIDPVPNIREMFVEFNAAYFDGLLAGVEVKWSSRMTLCAGVCCYEGRGGLCSIKLSEPLLKLRPRKDLVNTLLHEMIHALLFVTDNNKDHDGHGPEFHKHMYRINKQTGTNISVYHTFHDEVNLYRQHWWRCDGPCVKRPPYFGIVRRAMNRPPSQRDQWFNIHKQCCGGTFIKIKEPEKKLKRKTEKNDKNSKNNGNLNLEKAEASDTRVITNWLNKTNATKVEQNVSTSREGTLNRDSFLNTCKSVNSNVKTFRDEVGAECSGNTVFAGSSKNSSSDIHGFKMSANKSSTKEVDVFSGNGFKMIDTNTSKSTHKGSKSNSSCASSSRENFLKRIERNISGNTSRDDKISFNAPTCSALNKRKLGSSDVSRGRTNTPLFKKLKNTSQNSCNVDKNSSMTNQENIEYISANLRQPSLTILANQRHVRIELTNQQLDGYVPDKTLENNVHTQNILQNSNKIVNSDEVIVIDDVDNIFRTKTLVECPACPAKIPEHEMNEHLDSCLS